MTLGQREAVEASGRYRLREPLSSFTASAAAALLALVTWSLLVHCKAHSWTGHGARSTWATKADGKHLQRSSPACGTVKCAQTTWRGERLWDSLPVSLPAAAAPCVSMALGGPYDLL